MKIDLSKLFGNKREVEQNDLPPNHTLYLLNKRSKKAGQLSRREGIKQVYADRPYEYEYTTPKLNRGVSGFQGLFYNSWKRKTIAKVLKDGVHYTFLLVIDESKNEQKVRIYRVRLDSNDNVSHKVDQQEDGTKYTTYSNLVDIGLPYNPYYVVFSGKHPAFLEASMVYDPDNEELVVAVTRVVLTDIIDNSYVRVFRISDIFEDNWGGDNDGTPTWTQLGDDVEAVDGVTSYVTHDIDIDIDSSGNLYLVYGYYDNGTGKYIVRRKYCENGTTIWDDADEVVGGTNQHLYGCVIKVISESSVDKIYLGYFMYDTDAAESGGYGREKIYKLDFDEVIGNAVLIDTIRTMTADIDGNYVHAERCLYGPYMTAEDDTLIFAYRRNSLTDVWVKIGSSDPIIAVNDLYSADQLSSVYDWILQRDGDSLPWGVLTNWGITVKDGVFYIYYATYGKGSGAFRDIKMYENGEPVGLLASSYFQIYRKAFVFDTTDQDYTGSFFEAELVGEHEFLTNFLNAYNIYESDSLKRISYIRFIPWTINMDVPAVNYSSFEYIRQDRGVLGGSVELTQMSLKRYDASKKSANLIGVGDNPDGGTNQYERVDVVQCDDGRFYIRENYMWKLFKGIMDESNSFILNNTNVDDRAFMFSRVGGLRAGCGTIDSNNERTPPVWYNLIDRYMYRNDFPRLEERRLTFDYTSPTPGGISVVPEVITDIDDEPYGTDTNDDEERYARFSATRPNGDDDEEPNYYCPRVKQGDFEAFHDPVPRVTHPYKYILERQSLYDDGDGEIFLKQPYIDVFFGYALRYIDGGISQIFPIGGNGVGGSVEPFQLGWEVTAIGDDNTYNSTLKGRMMKITTKLIKWNFDINGVMNPRIEAIMFFWGLKTGSGITAENCVWRLVKDVLISKQEPFLDREWDGDAQWVENDQIDSPHARAIVKMTTYIDYKNYQKFFLVSENAVDMLGHGTPVMTDINKTAYLEGYKYAGMVGDRIFYGNVKMNYKVSENDLRWSSIGVMGGRTFPQPGVVGIESVKRMGFKIYGCPEIGDDNIIAIGENDIEWGRVVGRETQWQLRGTLGDYGTTVPHSIAKIAEEAETGRFGGLSFLNAKSGLRVFDLISSKPVTDDVNEDFVDNRNPAGTRTTTTRKGVKSLTDDDAMVIHLPDYRLMLLHFPTDGVTFVRDFGLEGYLRKLGMNSGDFWMNWEFSKNPTAWCISPEGYLLFTDGEQFYRWRPEDEEYVDAGSGAIECGGRIANIPFPKRGFGIPARLMVEYDLKAEISTAPTLTVSIIKDDGQRQDVTKVLAETRETTPDVRTIRQERFNGSPGKATQSFSLAWALNSPENVVSFDLFGLYFESEDSYDY